MAREEVDCQYIRHLLNKRDMTIGSIFLRILFKEGVPYVDSKQLGVVASVKMMYVLENHFFNEIKNQRECASQNMWKYVY